MLLCVSDVFSLSLFTRTLSSYYTSRSLFSRARIYASFFFASAYRTWSDVFWKDRLSIEEKLLY
jgi:hypothetical protein